ncbi:hypothetical protein TrLO_g74 [Triparma laevis f. longispina]|uniref:Uncharacterized protein n=1 Tax=Triparma laevis f. longispina TaxID=1714387 RepID=A0A9W7CNH6_9STRA|nr:hypothetical protein TrLO_g74 [Triparma laevis f. longispina]
MSSYLNAWAPSYFSAQTPAASTDTGATPLDYFATLNGPILLIFFLLSLYESWRQVYFLLPPMYKHRLSCYYTHAMTVYSTFMLVLWVTSRVQLLEGEYPNRYLTEVLPVYHVLMKNATVIACRLSDLISVLFTILLSFFIYQKKFGDPKNQIVTPLQNQPVTPYRIWNNIYIHYLPGQFIRLLEVPGVANYLKYSYNKRALTISTLFVLTWFGNYYKRFDKCYGLKYNKNAGRQVSARYARALRGAK